jgi:soluble lytic murein transglycosylase-like protein
MVRAVTIKTSAERNELPGAQFSARSASGADFGGQIGEGLQALSQGVADMSGAMENAELLRLQEQRQLRDFTLAADYTQFVADSETGLAEAGQNMEGGAWEFQKNFMLNNDASFEQWATDRGLTETEQAEWRARHADVRRGLSARALSAEFTERNRFYEASIKTSVDALRTRIDQDPANYDAAVAESDALIERAGVSPAAKDALRVAARQDLASALAMTMVQRDADQFLRMTGGVVRSSTDTLGAKRPADVAAAIAQVESGNVDGLISEDPDGAGPAGGGAVGRMQLLPATAERMANKLGVEFDVERLRTDGDYNRSLGQAYLQELTDRYDGDVFLAITAYHAGEGNVDGWLQSVGDPREGEITREAWLNGVESRGNPRSAAYPRKVLEQLGATDALTGGAPGGETVETAELDPRLADLPYEERVRLRGVAEQRINQQRQADQQQQRQVYESRLNALRLQVIDGEAGPEQIAAARAAGWLTDAGDIQNLNSMAQQRRQETADVDRYDSLVASGGAFDPYNNDHKAAADAAFARDPSASNLQAIVDRTGFVPPAAASFVRGGLLSKDPEQVKAVASLAAEVITRSPNAFTAFEGGAAINASAVEFLRLSELGYSSDQAASEVMRMNDPQEAERRRVAAPQVNAFREELRRNVNFNLSTADFGGRALDERQAAAVNADYSAIALEHFEQYANPEAARAFARRQVAALWGEGANGTIVKYPPEKIYPPVGGSHDYLYRQAAARVQASAGVEVDPRQIFLMPVPGVTGAEWRAGRPPAYQVFYRTEVDGQAVYDTVPGAYRFNVPTAALEQERAGNEARFRRSQQRRENSRQFPGQSAPGMPGVGGIGF